MKRTPVILAIAVVSVGILMSGGQRQTKGKTPQAAGLTAEARTAINTVGDDLAGTLTPCQTRDELNA